MVDFATAIEAAGTGVGGTAILFGALWRPVVKRHDERRALTIFLSGTPASPGMAAVPPAGDRLVGVERGLMAANAKLDGHSTALEGLAVAVKELMVEMRVSSSAAIATAAAAGASAASVTAELQGIAGQVKDVAHEVHANTGASLRDSA